MNIKKKILEMRLYWAKRKEAERAGNPKPIIRNQLLFQWKNREAKLSMKQPKLGPKGLKYKINQVIDTVPS